LFVAFTAAQVWSDSDRANAAVDREASALRTVVVLAAAFPGEAESRLQALVRRHIEQVTTQEWPMMARGTATLRFTPLLLVEAMQLTLALSPNTEGAKIAQRGIATALESALDACLCRPLQRYWRLQWSTAIIELPLPSRLVCLQPASLRPRC
jgi:hypothetical protein